jgi:hypothetical protein
MVWHFSKRLWELFQLRNTPSYLLWISRISPSRCGAVKPTELGGKIERKWTEIWKYKPIAVTARSQAWTHILSLECWGRGFESHSRNVCLRSYSVCDDLCVTDSGHATGWSSFQRVLPTLYRTNKLKKGYKAIDTTTTTTTNCMELSTTREAPSC